MLENESQSPVAKPKSSSLTAKEWHSHIQAWKKTSASKVGYCREHGLNADHFYYWYKRLLKPQPKPSNSGFIQVLPKKNESTDKLTIEITFPNQVRMTLSIKENRLLGLIMELGDATTVIR